MPRFRHHYNAYVLSTLVTEIILPTTRINYTMAYSYPNQRIALPLQKISCSFSSDTTAFFSGHDILMLAHVPYRFL